MSDSLEEKLKKLEGPKMPADVEARIRQRLSAEARPKRSGKPRRFAKNGSYGKLLLLVGLLATAGWVLRSEVAPVLRAAWERAHCWIDPNAKKP